MFGLKTFAVFIMILLAIIGVGWFISEKWYDWQGFLDWLDRRRAVRYHQKHWDDKYFIIPKPQASWIPHESPLHLKDLWQKCKKNRRSAKRRFQ